MNVHIQVTTPLKRLRKAAPLPNLQCTEMEARHWFAGMWHGIALGLVIGVSVAIMVLE